MVIVMRTVSTNVIKERLLTIISHCDVFPTLPNPASACPARGIEKEHPKDAKEYERSWEPVDVMEENNSIKAFRLLMDIL